MAMTFSKQHWHFKNDSVTKKIRTQIIVSYRNACLPAKSRKIIWTFLGLIRQFFILLIKNILKEGINCFLHMVFLTS